MNVSLEPMLWRGAVMSQTVLLFGRRSLSCQEQVKLLEGRPAKSQF